MKAAKTRAANKKKHALHPGKPAGPAGKAHKAKPHKALHHKPGPVRHKHLTPKQAKQRALTTADAQCCTATAVAASLAAAGWGVNHHPLTLHLAATEGHPGQAASIWQVLQTAAARGIGGIRPVSFEPVTDLGEPGQLASDGTPRLLILGADMPGQHAILSVCGWWWTWGRWHDPADFPDAVVDEAWQVAWPSPLRDLVFKDGSPPQDPAHELFRLVPNELEFLRGTQISGLREH